MTRPNKAFLTLAFIALALPLAGCESVDNAVYGMKERITAIKMPEYFTSKKETNLQEEEPRTQAADAETDTSEPAAFTPEMIEGGMDGNFIAAIDPAATTPMTTVTEGADCPPVNIVEDLAALHQFANPDRPTPETRVSSVVLRTLATECVRNETNIAVGLNLTFEGKLGPRARVAASDQPSFAYPYFVAITTKDGNIVAKEVFAATITYRPEDETTLAYETMRQIIPLGGELDGDYEILVGFQLTEGELAYNRALSEGPAASDYVPEHYIAPSLATEAATTKPMTVLPGTKPPAPVAATIPEPAPAPAPAPVAPAAEEVTEEAVEEAVEAAPTPATIVSPVATETETETTAPKAATINENGEVSIIEETPEELTETTEEEPEPAILEENAIIDADTINTPVDPLNPHDVPVTMDVE